MSEENPYEQFMEPVATPDSMKELMRLAGLVDDAEQALKSAEATVKEAESNLAYLLEEAIPGLMDEIGIEQFKTRDGVIINVAEKIRASILAKNKAKAMTWLMAHDFGAIIKRSVTAAFAAGETEKVKELMKALKDQGYKNVKEDNKVEPATIAALVREELGKGNDIFPPELFSVFRQRVADVTRPKG